MTNALQPKDHAELVALFRAQVLGPVLHRDLLRGELKAELEVLSKRVFRPPGNKITRTYSACTLMRWRRKYLREGLAGLLPQSRRLGDALEINDELRELVLEIRRQHPSAPASLVVETLIADGRLAKGKLTAQTLRRLYRKHGLHRIVRARAARPSGERRRWEAGSVGELWHADVCHGKAITINGRKTPVRIHALLDDKSRYIISLQVHSHEREIAMLDMTVEAIAHGGAPKVLYLDNGPTYVGEALATACARLNIQLLHASPYDPQARGKMERFWRTMREGCLDHMGDQPSLHAVQIRLAAFVAERYHKNAHASLLGKSPAQVWKQRELLTPTKEELKTALTVRETRLVRNDCTLSVGNVDWEVREAFLARRQVMVCRSLYAPTECPWIEHEERIYKLHKLNAIANGRLRKRRKPKPGIDAVDFEPVEVLRDQLLHNAPRHGGRDA